MKNANPQKNRAFRGQPVSSNLYQKNTQSVTASPKNATLPDWPIWQQVAAMVACFGWLILWGLS